MFDLTKLPINKQIALSLFNQKAMDDFPVDNLDVDELLEHLASGESGITLAVEAIINNYASYGEIYEYNGVEGTTTSIPAYEWIPWMTFQQGHIKGAPYLYIDNFQFKVGPKGGGKYKIELNCSADMSDINDVVVMGIFKNGIFVTSLANVVIKKDKENLSFGGFLDVSPGDSFQLKFMVTPSATDITIFSVNLSAHRISK